MNRILCTTLICLVALSVFAQSDVDTSQALVDQEHTKWIDNTLRSIHRIKVGQTRSDLLKLFTIEGGLSWPSQRTYVYRHCPYIKVDVKFAVDGRDSELPTDRIVEISRPYLDWSVMD
jgi:hypothetical protein